MNPSGIIISLPVPGDDLLLFHGLFLRTSLDLTRSLNHALFDSVPTIEEVERVDNEDRSSNDFCLADRMSLPDSLNSRACNWAQVNR